MIKHQRWFRLFVSSGLSLLAVFVFIVPALALDCDWLIKQKQILYGNVEVYVGKSGVMILCKENDYSFSCCAPNWDAILSSDKRKLYNKRTYADWSKKGIRTALSIQVNDDFYNWPLKFDRKIRVKDVDADLYAFPYKYEHGGTVSLKMGNVGTYVTTTVTNAPKQVQQFVQAVFDLPPNQGMPLRFAKIGNTQSFGFGLKYNRKPMYQSLLETTDIKRQKFSLPNLSLKGYKLAKENDIVVKQGEVDKVFTELMTD